MADRRARTSHVRPRPASGSRPAPVKVRQRAPAPSRLSAHHAPIRRSNGMPVILRVLFALVVLATAAGVLYVGVGGLGTVARALSTTLTGFVEDVTATPVPSATPTVVSESPRIAAPSEPYTNAETVDLVITVDPQFAGDPDYTVRIYLALEDQAPAPIDEVSVGATPQTVVPVLLTKGINDFSATVIGPGGESEQSPIVRYVLDTSKPGIKLTAPKDGATVNRKAVDLEGRTQARSTLQARNTTTGESIGGSADGEGAYTLRLPLIQGPNRIVITATDPAGNVNELELTLNRGSGELRAAISASAYKIKRGDLPVEIQLTVTVDDPDGRPLAGADVTFSLAIPGISAITGDARTDDNGRATFRTTVPKGADTGGGSAAVLVDSDEFGEASDQTVITITK